MDISEMLRNFVARNVDAATRIIPLYPQFLILAFVNFQSFRVSLIILPFQTARLLRLNHPHPSTEVVLKCR
jgi:hypothetical protein